MLLEEMHPQQLHTAVAGGLPLLVPVAGLQPHGAHLALGGSLVAVREVCVLIAARTPAVVAPALHYGPTGHALAGPVDGSVSPATDAFGAYAKGVLGDLREMGWRRIYVVVADQGHGNLLALTCARAAAELAVEGALEEGFPRGWYADQALRQQVGQDVWERVQVLPLVPAQLRPTAADPAPPDGHRVLLLALRPTLAGTDQAAAGQATEEEDAQPAAATSAKAAANLLEAVVAAWVARLAPP